MSLLELPGQPIGEIAVLKPTGNVTPSYSLSQDELADHIGMLSTLSAAHAFESGVDPPRYSLHEVLHSDPASNLARTVECEVFNEKFGDDPEIMELEYEHYEASSIFLS